HTPPSGRPLVGHEFQNNLTRTAVELMLAYANATNSCHSNSADEAFTTPGEQTVPPPAPAQRAVRAPRRPRPGDPARGDGAVQAHDECSGRLAGDEGRGGGGRGSDP